MKYFLFSILCLLGVGLYAQPAAVKLTGTLTMQTGEQFPYTIIGTDSGDVLKGIAITYAEPNETKAVIKGRIDKQRKKITFRETEIISSHDVKTQAFMCLLHASLENKQGKITGAATSEEADNTACTPGTITFTNTEEVNNVFSSHDKYDVVVNMGEKKAAEPAKTQPEPVQQEIVTKQEKITSGVEKTYNWVTDSIVVEVWDGGDYDGDKVTISMDGKPYLSKYVLLNSKKRFVIPLKDKELHHLNIFADEEGVQAPNTASLMLTDGLVHYSLLAYNPKGATSIVAIKKNAGK